MNRFQISEISEKNNHAGTKANCDITQIAKELGFVELDIRYDSFEHSFKGKILRQKGYYRDWKAVVKNITDGSIVLIQNPYHAKQLTREKSLRLIKKKAKIISLVHDVEELRAYRYNDYYKHEFDLMLEVADVLIVHNEVMKNWFVSKGFSADKIVTLGIFDYLQFECDENKTPSFEKSINVAGNLDPTKCGFILGLTKLQNIKVNLFGSNFDQSVSGFDNIIYHGSFPVDEIPNKLTSGFGLVWDGNDTDGCGGDAGNYLRFNNPHKLSLCLSSGLPVIIWSEAAEAKFVKENNVGLCIDRLSDLNKIFEDMDENQYKELQKNISVIRHNMITGYYAKKALNEALIRLQQ